MKIEYRTPAGTGAYSSLADDSSNTLLDKISGFAPRCSKTAQIEPLAFSTTPHVADRGNRLWEISFLVDQVHASPDAAALFLTTQAALFDALEEVDLKITQGAQVLYLATSVLTRFDPAPLSDKTTQIGYTFAGKTFNETAP